MSFSGTTWQTEVLSVGKSYHVTIKKKELGTQSMKNSEGRQTRRSSEETLRLNFLLHVGFSKALLAHVKLREDNTAFSKRSIERASEQIDSPWAYQQFGWPTRPANKIPGKALTSKAQLIEMSLLASAMYYLYGRRVYDSLTLWEVIEAYDLYTNLRKTAGQQATQISPDTAYWLACELSQEGAWVPYCQTCKIRYYSSVEQKIKNSCPFCKRASTPPSASVHHIHGDKCHGSGDEQSNASNCDVKEPVA